MAHRLQSSSGFDVVAHHDLDGRADAMQVVRAGDFLYVGHTGTTGAGTSILDVSDPAEPKLVEQWPSPAHSHTHKVQIADGLLLVNHEKFPYRKPAAGPVSAGLAIYRLADPARPEQVGFWESGGLGVHRVVWTGGRHAHMSATPEGFRDRIWIVLDISTPGRPHEVARWWWRGQHVDEQPDWPDGQRYAAHHALIAGDRAYVGYDDAGMVVLDVTRLDHPTFVTRLNWGGGATHTCLPLPGRDLVVVTDEQQHDGPDAPERTIRVVDVSGEPEVVGKVPPPLGDFRSLPMRFGAHNLHENRAGSYRSERIVFATYFSAGLRVYDLAEPTAPVEIAHWIGPTPGGQAVPQANDLWVEPSGLVWVTDRIGGGLTALRPQPWLRERLEEAEAA
jgi:hypothetical protein